MTDGDFVERVHAYSKWLLGLKETDSDSAAPHRSIGMGLQPRTEDHGHS